MRYFTFALMSLLSISAYGRSTDLCFSEDEVSQMRQKAKIVSETGARCLQKYWDTHEEFYNTNKYSRYFGNRNEGLNTENERKKVILFVLWPDFLNKFRPQDRERVRKSKDLKELEALVKALNPSILPELNAKKADLKLNVRAKDELDQLISEGKPIKLLPNTSLNLQNISCVDMTRRCLAAGFEAAKLEATWKKIDTLVKANNVSGVVLQKALADLGWNTIYFNPDTSKNKDWDVEDREVAPLKPKTPGGPMPVWNPIWGGHAERWSGSCMPDGSLRKGRNRGGVLCTDHYELGYEPPIPIDDKRTLVNFGTRPPAEFAKVPFFVGTAHSGYHVFPGSFGGVIEAHSKRRLTAKDNIEQSVFNPIDQKNGGGPRWTNEERYRSGVIAVPPGTLGLPLLKNQGSSDCVDLRPNSPR
jgi:hypothetical protein